ncbi:MAG: type II toxin-antitoxin system VapC family toxin [Cytophagales bacterium]|nr:type II toxin-antitoxin system VapC family toxin [Cytophagales bacterium]
MQTLCIDTNIYSALRRGDKSVVKKISQYERVVVPVVVLGELRAGFLGGSKIAENQQNLTEFLASEFVYVAKASEATTSIYAELVAELKRKGKPIPTNDIWIAAIALEQRARLLTLDAHFANIDGLNLA